MLRILGVPLVGLNDVQFLSWLLDQRKIDRGADVHFCNAYTFALAETDASLREVLATSALNLGDGTAVRFAGLVLCDRLGSFLSGPDMMAQILKMDTELRHYFLGGSPSTLALLQKSVAARYPRAQVVGVNSPPFRDLTPEERDAQRRDLIRVEPDVVWVGLGTPKQVFECAQLSRTVPAVFVSVGAAFDFLAGTKARAPAWLSRAGLEWAFRFAQEPKRLWRRYMFGNARFICLVIKQVHSRHAYRLYARFGRSSKGFD